MARLRVDFYSSSLHTNTSAMVILPENVVDFLYGGIRYNDEGKIPVFWLLHGMGDDCTGWERYTHVERYAISRGVAVVMPSVLNQCYYGNMVKGLRYFDFIADEVMEVFREMFPQFSARREDNFIAGISMGGYGALRVALTYPERYAAVGCFSSGNLLEIESILPQENDPHSFMEPFYGVARNVLGTEKIIDALGTEHDIDYLLDKAVADGRELPDIRMYCGTEDFLLGISDKYARHVSSLLPDDRFSYQKGPGTHNWDFWDHWLPKFMSTCGFEPRLAASQIFD